MNPAYQKWIEDYKAKHKFVNGLCGEATLQMVAAFPELKRVPGFAYSALHSTEHFWCIDPDGEVVDPTADQFHGLPVDYVPFKPGDSVKVGKCMNCGEDIFKEVQSLDGTRLCICSKECEKEFVAWQDGGGEDD